LGKFFSSRLKMPSHAMAFSWILLAIIATGIVLATGQLKLGPDIKGGTNLIYQIDQTTVGNSGYRVTAKDFIAPILNRILRRLKRSSARLPMRVSCSFALSRT
jgi:SecD/SecF fusion protein